MNMKIKLLLMNFSMLLPHINFAGNGVLSNPRVWKAISRTDFSKILVEMNQTYDHAISFRLDVTHASYKDYTSSIPSDQVKGFISRSGDQMKSKLLGIQTLINSKYKLVIDSASRVIMLSNPEKISGTLITREDMLDNMNLCNSIDYLEENQLTIYRMSFDDNYPYKFVNFSINKIGLVQKMEFFMNTDVSENHSGFLQNSKPRIEIICENYSLSASYPDNYFDEAKYIRFVEEKPLPTEEYSKYKVLDLRGAKKFHKP